MAILQTSLSIPKPKQSLSFSFSLSLTSPNHLSFRSSIPIPIHSKTTSVIRMGGGPRTYPGGVSKWQWKRMQNNKSKQLLKARLCRERQIYEMRKRAELKAAVSELERPWEVVEKAPNLFSVSADEQVKVLADRFQRPGGFDLWTERDGPQLFDTYDDLPTARFFPKGVVHSVRPYKSITGSEGDLEDENENEVIRRSSSWNLRSRSLTDGEDDLDSEDSNLQSSLGPSSNGKRYDSKLNNRGNRRKLEPRDEIATSFQENDSKNHRRYSNRKLRSGSLSEGADSSNSYSKSSLPPSSKVKNWGNRRKLESYKPVGSTELNRGQNGLDRRQSVPSPRTLNDTRQNGRGGKGSRLSRSSSSEIYDMSLEQDGRYRFQPMKSR